MADETKATYTANLNLEKPGRKQKYDIGVHNANYDKIDTAIKHSDDELSKHKLKGELDHPNESVYTKHLHAKCVTQEKIANYSVGYDQLIGGSVNENIINTNGINTKNIKDKCVTKSKLANDVLAYISDSGLKDTANSHKIKAKYSDYITPAYPAVWNNYEVGTSTWLDFGKKLTSECSTKHTFLPTTHRNEVNFYDGESTSDRLWINYRTSNDSNSDKAIFYKFGDGQGNLATLQAKTDNSDSDNVATVGLLNAHSVALPCVKNTNGWTKLANDLILQWGKFKRNADNDYNWLTFNIAFPNQAFVAVATVIPNSKYKYSDADKGTVSVCDLSRTGCNLGLTDNSAWRSGEYIYWQAIGY